MRRLRKHEKLLIPLQFDGSVRHGHEYPGALGYVQAFIGAGFDVSQIVALGDNPVAVAGIQNALPQLPGIRPIDTFAHMPNNHAAHQIREAWGWR